MGYNLFHLFDMALGMAAHEQQNLKTIDSTERQLAIMVSEVIFCTVQISDMFLPFRGKFGQGLFERTKFS